eukprot:2432229-Amphidinium_carterae.1
MPQAISCLGVTDSDVKDKMRRDGSHACKCRNRKKETIDTQTSCVSKGSTAQRCFEERCSVAAPVTSTASPVLVTSVTATPAEVEVDVEDEEQEGTQGGPSAGVPDEEHDLFGDEWPDELHRELF